MWQRENCIPRADGRLSYLWTFKTDSEGRTLPPAAVASGCAFPANGSATSPCNAKSEAANPKWHDEKTLDRLVAALADPMHATKAAAARAAGISYATLARWQYQFPGLVHEVWQTGWDARRHRRQAAKAAQHGLRRRRPAPTKQMRMVCWFLVFRVHPIHTLVFEHEVRACERVNLPWEHWQAAKRQFPRLMEGVRAKRARRLAHLMKHGSIGANYCPPDPARRFPPPYPAFALYYWKRGAWDTEAQSPRTGQCWL